MMPERMDLDYFINPGPYGILLEDKIKTMIFISFYNESKIFFSILLSVCILGRLHFLSKGSNHHNTSIKTAYSGHKVCYELLHTMIFVSFLL